MKRCRVFRLINWVGISMCLSVSACSSFPASPGVTGHLPLGLETAEKIMVGVSTTEEVQKMLGDPRIKIPGAKPGLESWLYCNQEKCSQPRLTLQINLKSSTVDSVGIALRDGEPEQSLDRLRARYPNLDLKLERYLYSYRDYFETVESYLDSKRGVTLSVAGAERKVSSISWSVPPLTEIPATQSERGFPKVSKLPERVTASEP